MILKCKKGCCSLKTTTYTSTKNPIGVYGNNKSGILLYDENTNNILLIQSKGNLWGIPKGTMEKNETYIDCAIREVLEETGLNLKGFSLENNVVIDTSVYYLVYHEKCDVDVQTVNKDNDVNSIGWVNLDCLKGLIKDNIIVLTKHTLHILKTFLNFES